jgi:pimeloyl-ACP methyl ester carboxylesterase
MLRHVDLPSANIAYRDEGSERLPPLVLVHGNSASHRSFAPQFESRLRERFRLIALDLPGHGESTLKPAAKLSYSLPTYATVVQELIERLGLKCVVLVGHSLGGHVSVEAADGNPAVAGLCIFGAPLISHPPRMSDAFLPNPEAGKFFGGTISRPEIEAVVAQLVGERDIQSPQVFIEDFERTDPAARTQLLESVNALEYRDEISIARRLNVPVAVIHGSKDKLANLAHIQELELPTLWRGAVQVIDGAGHSPHWEVPDAFGELLGAFASETFRLRREIGRSRA